MKESASFNQDAQVVYELIKASFDAGDYVSAQNLVSEYTRTMTAALRGKDSIK